MCSSSVLPDGNSSKRIPSLAFGKVQTTLQIYVQAVSEQKRAANAMVVGQLLFDGLKAVTATA